MAHMHLYTSHCVCVGGGGGGGCKKGSTCSSPSALLLSIAESQEGKKEGKEESRAGGLGEPAHVYSYVGVV